MKTENQKLTEILESKNLHGLLELIVYAKTNKKENNFIGDTVINLINNNKDSKINNIAKKLENSNHNPSLREAELMFNEIADNLSYYKEALNNYNSECKDDAIEVLREIYPNKSDVELKKMIA